MNYIVFIDVTLVCQDNQVVDLNFIMDKISSLNDNIQELLSRKAVIKKDLEELEVNIASVLSEIVTLKMEISSNQNDKANDSLKILDTMRNAVHHIRLEPMKQNKCRYFNRGYCKFKENCRFFHSSVICEDFLEIGICKSSNGCIKRHPKNCRYWCKRAEGCKRG